MSHTLRKVKLELGDELLTLSTGGKPLRAVQGADGPKIVSTIRELLEAERNLAKGIGTRQVVMLDSLVKPDEVILPDEDLDDIEGQKAAREAEEEELGINKRTLPYAVVFILPHIVSTDKVEAFLSRMVEAGLVILGHKQHELGREQLHRLLFSPFDGKANAREEQDEETRSELTQPLQKEPQSESQVDDNELEIWEEQLSVAPLYMLLLKAEEGDVVELWYDILGTGTDFEAVRQQPQSLIAEFGEEGREAPAWMPKDSALQRRLACFAFPALIDSEAPRLLLLPDTDHLQMLERLQGAGVAVLGHAQAYLGADTLDKLSGDVTTLEQRVGEAAFAAVISGESVALLPEQLEILYLSPSQASEVDNDQRTDACATEKAQDAHGNSLTMSADVMLFFPELASEIAVQHSQQIVSGSLDDPQTQMQIERRKESQM